MNNKTNNIIQFALLGLILIALPAGSWIYLKKGLDYQKETRSDLENLGKIEVRSFFEVDDEVWNKWGLDEKLKVISIEQNEEKNELIKKLNRQFKNSEGLAFIVLKEENRHFSEIEEVSNIHYVSMPLDKITAQINKIGKSSNIVYKTEFDHFILVDEKNVVKKLYDYRKEDEVKRLIEHVAILVPKAGR